MNAVFKVNIVCNGDELQLTKWNDCKEMGVNKMKQTNFLPGLVDEAPGLTTYEGINYEART